MYNRKAIYTEVKERMKREKAIGITTAIIASAVNFFLGFAKMFIGLSANSVGIISDGINNFGDVLTCGGGAAGLSFSDKKPSENFPAGFGKVEYFTTLLIAEILLIVGVVFTYFSIERLIFRRPIFFTWIYFAIVAGTMVLKFLLYLGFRYSHKKMKSEILKCQSVDCLMDTGITAAALIGYICSIFTRFPVDAVIGITIGASVIAYGIKTVKVSATKLIG